MSYDKRLFGQHLILTAPGEPDDGPLMADDGDVSWLHRARVGDNQGADGACSIFAFANWCEIMLGVKISDAQCLDLYRLALRRFGREEGSGLTVGEAFLMVHAAGWLPPGVQGTRRVRNLDGLSQQPILGAYKVTPAWQNPNKAGCLDHFAPMTILGLHLVAIVGVGRLNTPERHVWIENSWGLHWAWNGIGIMNETLHRRLNVEMWEIVL